MKNIIFLAIISVNSVFPYYVISIQMGSLGIENVYIASIYVGLIETLMCIFPLFMLRYMKPLLLVVLSNSIVFFFMVGALIIRIYVGPVVNRSLFYNLSIIFFGNGLNLMNCGSLAVLILNTFDKQVSNHAYGIVLTITHFSTLVIPYLSLVAK